MILLGRAASLFFLFGVFDAKGGEVVLLGVSRDLLGPGTSTCFYHSFRACAPFICIWISFEQFALLSGVATFVRHRSCSHDDMVVWISIFYHLHKLGLLLYPLLTYSYNAMSLSKAMNPLVCFLLV